MKNVKKMLILIVSVICVASLASTCFAQATDIKQKELRIIGEPEWVPGEIIVKFKDGVSDAVVRAIHRQHGVSEIAGHGHKKFQRLRIPRGKKIVEMVAAYGKNPNVEYAEPNYVARALMMPNDTYYSLQWNFDNPEYGGIEMEEAWDVQPGGMPGVVVAVVDTGVATQAPDLTQTAFVQGYDFVNDDNDPVDDEGHGTHVTGTIAQSTNDAYGVAGIAFHTAIMPVKVLDANGSGSYADIASGIYFATDNGADIINMSLGGTLPSNTLRKALSYASRNGVTVVCAAGNEYEYGNPRIYPAAYDDYCIAVGATGYDETRAYYSSTGSYVDIVAPGGDFRAGDLNGDGYVDGILQQTFDPQTPDVFSFYFYQGTSMAAPHVTGVAALLIANGVTGPAAIREALQNTADDLGVAGVDAEYGYGIVNAAAALNYGGVVPPPDPEPVGGAVAVSVDSMAVVSKGVNVNAVAYVYVVDGATGAPVVGANVVGNWTLNGASFGTTSSLTNEYGVAVLQSQKSKSIQFGDVFAVTITDVVDYDYDTTYPASGSIIVL